MCQKETQSRRCVQKKPSTVVVSKRNPVPSLYQKETQSRRCVKKKPSPVVVSKRNPVPSLCQKETQSCYCIKKKPSPVVVSKRNPIPSLFQKETQSRRCIKKKPSPVVVSKRNPVPPQYRQSCLSKNFNLEFIHVSVLYSSLMGNLDSSVGTVKGRTTDGCGSILARFKAFFSFRHRPALLGGGGANIIFSGYLWLFSQG